MMQTSNISLRSKNLVRDITGNTFINSSRKPQTTRANLDFSKKKGTNIPKSQIIVEEH